MASTGYLGESASVTRLATDPHQRTGYALPCWDADPELFFAEAPAKLEVAKTFCDRCLVRAGCLAGALSRREPAGVWGGQIFERGRVIATKRGRGRPPRTCRRETMYR